jgi:hypothetical protein
MVLKISKIKKRGDNMNHILISQGTREIEAGYYRFRATTTSPKDGGMGVVYSQAYHILDKANMFKKQKEWVTSLHSMGYKDVKITSAKREENTVHNWGNFMHLPDASAPMQDSLDFSLSDLNGEFILDI